MTRCTFIHAADLHLDAPFRGLGGVFSGRPEETGRLADRLREGTFTALARLVALCIREEADFLLLAGDVYNSAESSLRARLALRDAFVRLEREGIGVFLVHGNHDPLGVDDGIIPWPGNVTVFGPEAHACEAFARGPEGPGREPVALISGISHSGTKESRNLARLIKRKEPRLLNPDLFQIGLLHCNLADISGGHENYAPCTVSDLAEADLDYWALGHVHACRILDRNGKPAETGGAAAEAPLAAYSGSLQGLHVNESGPHGCLLGRVDERNRLTLRPAPLAPVQWEQVTLEPGPEITDIPALEALLLEHLEPLAPMAEGAAPTEGGPFFPPLAVPVRLTLAGRSPVDHALRKPGALEALREHLGAELSGSGLFIRDIIAATRPPVDIAAALERPDLAGAALRTAFALRDSTPALEELSETVLAPLFRKSKVRKAIPEPEAVELAALVEEAAFLCLDLLSPGLGGHNDSEGPEDA